MSTKQKFFNKISKYLRWIGQAINAQKSHIYLGKKVTPQSQLQILNILGIQKGSIKATYLGLPLIFPRSKLKAFSLIK